MGRWISWIVIACALLAITAWLVGRLVSDRYAWSQWLLWIPTPVAMAAMVAMLPAVLIAVRGRTNRRRVLGLWGVGLAVTLIYFGAIEHRLFRPAPQDGDGIRILHWSMSHTKEPFRPQAETILSQDADLAVLNDAHRATAPEFRAWSSQIGGESIRSDRFTILTKLPVLENRVLVNSDSIVVALLRLNARSRLDRELTVLLVDLPSSPRVHRMELARRVRRLLDEADAPAPDIVIGDFNMTRGGASLESIFPAMHHAYGDAGGGYAASYHRAFPLYHIDHVLLAADMSATSYRLIDPGIGRHRVQVVTVR